jgi:hypothetical protein
LDKLHKQKKKREELMQKEEKHHVMVENKGMDVKGTVIGGWW